MPTTPADCPTCGYPGCHNSCLCPMCGVGPHPEHSERCPVYLGAFAPDDEGEALDPWEPDWERIAQDRAEARAERWEELEP